MITVTRKFVRSDLSVPFFVGDKTTVNNHISNNYQGAQPKVLNQTLTLSNDLLTLTLIVTFVDQASKDQFNADSVIEAYRNARSQYNEFNSITESVTEITQ